MEQHEEYLHNAKIFLRAFKSMDDNTPLKAIRPCFKVIMAELEKLEGSIPKKKPNLFSDDIKKDPVYLNTIYNSNGEGGTHYYMADCSTDIADTFPETNCHHEGDCCGGTYYHEGVAVGNLNDSIIVAHSFYLNI